MNMIQRLQLRQYVVEKLRRQGVNTAKRPDYVKRVQGIYGRVYERQNRQ